MKTIRYAALALTLTAFSFAASASQQVSHEEAKNLNKIGVISAKTEGTLDTLEAELAVKAEAAGAKAWSITSANGRNQLHGTAVLYN